MNKATILWADDEIDLLKPYVLFLEEKGYRVVEVNNGLEALNLCKMHNFDIVFLDEHMPGLSGLETLTAIHDHQPSTPIVMITKSEDEGIMEKAIGEKIADYLIKPVNPNQILLTIKKNLDKTKIIANRNTEQFLEDFGTIATEINNCTTYTQWIELYKKLISWEIELTHSRHPMLEMIEAQKSEANREFAKFIRHNYTDWVSAAPDMVPVLSHRVFSENIFPLLDKTEKLFCIVIDNFRFDQWRAVKDMVDEFFTCQEESYFSILPTATQYSRNALFAGLLPLQIKTLYPELWVDEMSDAGKNMHEEILLSKQLQRCKRNETFSYHKINTHQEGEKLIDNFNQLEKYDLNIVVFNFIDMLTHARTESKMLRELASNEAAYRSLTQSWMQYSPLMALLQRIADKSYTAVLTTDHGTINVKNAQKIVSEKDNTSYNLRYKTGRHITYDPKKVFDIIEPSRAGLPSHHLSSKYIFALNNDFFAYPNNYNQYVAHFENTFQHGGISMEEMIVPFITLTSKIKK